jgi:hypothetical protein
MYLASWQLLPDAQRLLKGHSRIGVGLASFVLLWLAPSDAVRLVVFAASAAYFAAVLPSLVAEEDRNSAWLFCRKLWTRISASAG